MHQAPTVAVLTFIYLPIPQLARQWFGTLRLGSSIFGSITGVSAQTALLKRKNMDAKTSAIRGREFESCQNQTFARAILYSLEEPHGTRKVPANDHSVFSVFGAATTTLE